MKKHSRDAGKGTATLTADSFDLWPPHPVPQNNASLHLRLSKRRAVYGLPRDHGSNSIGFIAMLGYRRLMLILLAAASGLLAQPVRLHPANPHYLEYKGKPFLVVTSAEHYGAVLNGDFDFEKYLDTLDRDGMNYTRIFSGSYVEVAGDFGIKRNTLAPKPASFLSPWARSPVDGYPGGGNKFDLSRWNPEYFSRLRRFVAAAQERGILVEMTLFTSTYREGQWRANPLNPANNINGTAIDDFKRLHTLENGNILPHQERMVRKIVSELNQFDNVIFEIQNEPWADQRVTLPVTEPVLRQPVREKLPRAIEIPSEASLDWHDRVAGWIVSEEAPLPKKHLIAFNYCNFYHTAHRVPEHVSIVNFHYNYPEAARLNYGLGKLIGYDESGFQGGDDATYRREAWNFLIAGGGLFNSLDYSFSVGKEDGTDTEPNGPGGGSPTLRRQLRVLREFLEGFDFVSMKPDGNILRPNPALFVQALSKPGESYAIYVDRAAHPAIATDSPAENTPKDVEPKNSLAPNELMLSLPPGRYEAKWVDPRTGDTLGVETLTGGPSVQLRVPPNVLDVALRLVRRT